MERIKIANDEFEIVSINPRSMNLLEIVFTDNVVLSGMDLSEIELYTAGGIHCTTIRDYTTIYKGDGTTIIVLSNDGSVYTKPELPADPVPEEPYEPTPEELEAKLQEAKLQKVKLSKDSLQAYLQQNPIFSTVHNPEGGYYSVTNDKQQYLLGEISLTQMNMSAEIPYQPSWNETGKACTYDWTLEQLQQLAIEIGAFIKPKVSKQQEIEEAAWMCNTVDELAEVDASINAYEDIN